MSNTNAKQVVLIQNLVSYFKEYGNKVNKIDQKCLWRDFRYSYSWVTIVLYFHYNEYTCSDSTWLVPRVWYYGIMGYRRYVLKMLPLKSTSVLTLQPM